MYIMAQQPRTVPAGNAYVAFVTGRRQVPASASAVRVAPVVRVSR